MSFKIDFCSEQDIPKMADLDKQIFGEEGSIEVELLKEWYNINKYQWIVAKDEDGNCIGYMGVWHINEQAFNKILAGEITEKDFVEEDFIKFEEGNNIFCYISGFVVKDKNTRVAISLINKTVAYFRFLKEHNIKVKKVCAAAFTVKGNVLCQKLGFERIREDKPFSNGTTPVIYVHNLWDSNFSRVLNAVKEIFLDNDIYFG